jgi:hypothetical protein
MATLKNTIINDTGYFKYPSGTTAQRPSSPLAGMVRYNTDNSNVEYYNGTTWISVSAAVGYVTSGLITYLDAGNTLSYSGTGSTWYDISGSGNNGTVTGDISWVSNGSLSYFNFNSLSDSNYIYGTSSQDFQHVCMIFYPDFTLSGGAGLTGLMGNGTPSSNGDKSLRIQTGNPWTFAARNPGDINDWAYPNATTYRFNGTVSNNAVSGWNILTGYRTNRTNFANNSFTYYLGSSAYTGRGFRGRLAAVLLYNRQLTDAEDIQNYIAFKNRFGV